MSLSEKADEGRESRYFRCAASVPRQNGEVRDFTDLISALHEKDVIAAVATDLMALVKLKTPPIWGADIALGNAQHFGVPMAFGGLTRFLCHS